MQYVIIAIVFITLLMSIVIYQDVKSNRVEKLKLCKSILSDMLIVIMLFFMMTGRSGIETLTTFVQEIKTNQIESISITTKIHNIVEELKQKNVIFVSDIFEKIDNFNNTLDEANKQLNTNLYKQQIISDKIDDIKHKLEEDKQNTKSKIIWVGE